MQIKFIIFFVFVITFGTLPSFAESQSGLILTTDKDEYYTEEFLVVYGVVEEKKMPIVALKVYDPLGMILTANNVELDSDNSFTKVISLESPFYEMPGIYLVQVEYGKIKSEISFDITGDNPIPIDSVELEPEVLAMVTDKDLYFDNDYVVVAGIVTAKSDSPVLVGIYDQAGNPTGFYFGDVDENYEFSISFMAKAGVNFKKDGKYSAVAHYGDSEYATYFDFAKQDSSINNSNSKPSTVPTPDPPSVSQPLDPVSSVTKPAQTSVVNNNQAKTETKQETNPIQKESQDQIQEDDNLSVEDIELGMMLNEIQLNCDSSEYSDSVIYYDGMGPALLRLCKYNEALGFIDKSLLSDPNNIEVLTNKGIVLEKLGMHKEALMYFDSVLSRNHNYVPAINNKANILATLGDYEGASLLYKTALQIDPNHFNSKTNLSKIQSTLDYIAKSEVPIVYATYETSITGEDTLISSNDKTEIKSNDKTEINPAISVKHKEPESTNIFKQITQSISDFKNNILSFLK